MRMATKEESTTPKTRLAPFNPTCTYAQTVALKLLNLNNEDVLFDLGCGDGRFLLHAAESNASLRCVGIEIDPVYSTRAKESVVAATKDVGRRIDIREGDVMDPSTESGREHRECNTENLASNLSLLDDATAVFLYLLPKGIQIVRPLLEQAMKQRSEESKNFRVVSYMFSVKGWQPLAVDRSTKGECPVYLYDAKSVNLIDLVDS